MESGELKRESMDKLGRRERQIPTGAKRATDAARERILSAGIDVFVVRGDKLVRLSPTGKDQVVGIVTGRRKKALKSYTLVWKPRLRD